MQRAVQAEAKASGLEADKGLLSSHVHALASEARQAKDEAAAASARWVPSLPGTSSVSPRKHPCLRVLIAVPALSS